MVVEFSGAPVKRGSNLLVGMPVRYARCGFFAPTTKPVRCLRTIKGISPDPSITMVLNGKIGIPHWQILDALFSGYQRVWVEGEDRVVLEIRKYVVRKLYSKSSLISSSQIHGILMDLMEASISISTEKFHSTFSLIEEVRYTEGDREVVPVPRRYGGEFQRLGRVNDGAMTPSSKSAQLITIRFGMEFSAQIFEGVRVIYNSALISELKYGISKALVREIYSHKSLPNGGYKIEGLLERHLGESSESLLVYKKRELSRDSEALLKLGVRFDNMRLTLV